MNVFINVTAASLLSGC